MRKYIIGLDSGTSGIKAVLFDLNGNEIAKSGMPLTAKCPVENWYEEDVEEIWDNACKCIKEISSRYPADEIAGIGITAQGDGLWLVDENGVPTRNGCCFCDGRAVKELEEWEADGTVQKVFDLAGTRLCTGNPPCILKWMDRNDRPALDRAKYIMHLKDVLFLRLTGTAISDATDQSLIFIDMRTREYDDRLFSLYGLSDYRQKFPPMFEPAKNKISIKNELAEKLGLSDKTIITCGPMDVTACATGAGVMKSGHCCSIIGTAALHEMVIDEPCRDKIFTGMTVSHVTKKNLRLMASFAGTPNLEWVINTFGAGLKEHAEKAGANIYDYVEELISSVPIGSNGVMYHPYLLAGGERAPFTEPNAKASFTGISHITTIADIMRACYEGVALAMLDCYNHMPQPVEQITVCGGGASSNLWCQMFADAVGKPVRTVNGEELGARGAAIANAVAQGFFRDFDEALDNIISTKKIYEPNEENHKRYLRFYKLYKSTYEALMPTWKQRFEILFEK
jgi:sugar (pentulose or hexulose) kinase